MKHKKLNTGDFVVLKNSWIIIYKIVRFTRDGLRALCINFRGEKIDIPVFNLEKYSGIQQLVN